LDLLGETAKWLPLTVLGASLLGSAHCVGMCGGIVLVSCRSRLSEALYHFFRLLGYLSIGCIAGWLGREFIGSMNILGTIGLVAFSVIFVWMGLRLWKDQPMHMGIGLERIPGLRWLWAKTLASGTVVRSSTTGFLTAFLPCGWLYSYVVLAVGTSSIAGGAGILFLFWLGTLPALTISLRVVQRASRPVARWKPKLVGALFILAGIGTVWAKVSPQLHDHGSHRTSGSESCR